MRALRDARTGQLSDVGAPSGEYDAPGARWIDVPETARHGDYVGVDGVLVPVPMPTPPPDRLAALVDELEAAGSLSALAAERIRKG